MYILFIQQGKHWSTVDMLIEQCSVCSRIVGFKRPYTKDGLVPAKFLVLKCNIIM
jgi:hypothetical protein